MSRLARVKGYTRKFRGKAVRVSGYLRKVIGTRRGKAAVAVAVLAAGGYGARRYMRKRRSSGS